MKMFPRVVFRVAMRRAVVSVSKAALVAMGVAAMGLGNAKADTPLNLLFFGNSFSQGGVQWRVADLAAADGYARPTVLLDSLGGQDLRYHINEVVNNPTNNVDHTLINGKTWDYVIIQEHSIKPTHIGNPTAFRADALELYRTVRDHASGHGTGVVPVLFQTWARAYGHSYYPAAFANPTAMQMELTNNTALAQADINAAEGAGTALLAPVGEAFEDLNFIASLYGADLYHPSAEGSLLASMVLYRTIYNEYVSDIPYSVAQSWAGVNEASWLRVAAAADAMVIPEPSTVALLIGAGVVGLFYLRRRAIRVNQ